MALLARGAGAAVGGLFRIASSELMIVREFLQWLRTASAGERADGASALARAYLFSPLSLDDRAAAEGAMLMLLDDPSPLVRRALAEAFASSQAAPPAPKQARVATASSASAPANGRPLDLFQDMPPDIGGLFRGRG